MSWAIVTHKSKSASHGQKRTAACFHYLVIGWVRPCFSARIHALMQEELLLDHLFLWQVKSETTLDIAPKR
jgi:hypothetical protein